MYLHQRSVRSSDKIIRSNASILEKRKYQFEIEEGPHFVEKSPLVTRPISILRDTLTIKINGLENSDISTWMHLQTIIVWCDLWFSGVIGYIFNEASTMVIVNDTGVLLAPTGRYRLRCPVIPTRRCHISLSPTLLAEMFPFSLETLES